MIRPILLLSLVAATLFAFTGNTGESEATFPGANGEIVFTSNRDGNEEIYLMNADGTGVTRLTDDPSVDSTAAWNPDGTKIAFYSTRDGDAEIFAMNRNGTGVTQLTLNSATDLVPDWSPDGTKIAFSSNRDGNDEIYIMDADGANQTRCTNHLASDGDPVWSPDGSKILFNTDRDAPNPTFNEVYVMNSDCSGGGLLNLSNSASTFDVVGDWSPDGTQIVYHKELTSPGGNWEVFLMNSSDGSSQTNITNHGAIDHDPVWSPDGTRVLFHTERDGNAEIYTMNPNGSGLTRLTNNPASDFFPDWGPVAAPDPPGVGGVVELAVGSGDSPVEHQNGGGHERGVAALVLALAAVGVAGVSWRRYRRRVS